MDLIATIDALNRVIEEAEATGVTVE